MRRTFHKSATAGCRVPSANTIHHDFAEHQPQSLEEWSACPDDAGRGSCRTASRRSAYTPGTRVRGRASPCEMHAFSFCGAKAEPRRTLNSRANSEPLDQLNLRSLLAAGFSVAAT